MSKTRYYNVHIDIHDYTSALEVCNSFYSSDHCHTLFYLNAHCFNIAQKNEAYFSALNNADLLLNDGVGISIGARLKGIRLKSNML